MKLTLENNNPWESGIKNEETIGWRDELQKLNSQAQEASTANEYDELGEQVQKIIDQYDELKREKLENIELILKNLEPVKDKNRLLYELKERAVKNGF